MSVERRGGVWSCLVGNTRYVLEDCANRDYFRLTRLNNDGQQVTFFPAELFLARLADRVREERVGKLEQMKDTELLGLPGR